MLDDDDRFDPRHREPEQIEVHELETALRGLALLGDDPFLGMQATNSALVDAVLMPMETEARAYRDADEGIDLTHAMLLNALSQQWLFALYELLRTWRERADKVVRWHDNRILPDRIAAFEKDEGSVNLGRVAFARTLRRVADEPQLSQEIREDLLRTLIPFRRLEFLRMALAKHEVHRRPKTMARSPGHARIDLWTGSMSYELSNGDIILGEVTRRSFADTIRSLAYDRAVPSAQDVAGFERFMSLESSEMPNFERRE